MKLQTREQKVKRMISIYIERIDRRKASKKVQNDQEGLEMRSES